MLTLLQKRIPPWGLPPLDISRTNSAGFAHFVERAVARGFEAHLHVSVRCVSAKANTVSAANAASMGYIFFFMVKIIGLFLYFCA